MVFYRIDIQATLCIVFSKNPAARSLKTRFVSVIVFNERF